MAELPIGGKWRELAISFGAGVALLSASLVNFLVHNDYPFLRLEVALSWMALLTVCAFMAPLYHGQRQWGRSFLEGLLAAVFVDLNTSSLVLAIAVGAAAALFTWWKRTSLLGMMAVFGAVTLIATAVGIGGDFEWVSSEKIQLARPAEVSAGTPRPAILHILLDEHIGVEGLPPDNPNSRSLRHDLQSFYMDRGFALYGGAYSEHLHSVNAIPHILNFGERLGKDANFGGVEVGSTEHFERLINRGYRLLVFQSDFADFCSGAIVTECVTYDSYSLRPTLDVPLKTQDRTQLILYKFITLSDLATGAIRRWNLTAWVLRQIGWEAPRFNVDMAGRSSSVGAIEVLDGLSGQLRAAQPGNAYFAHILLPHYPYVVRSDCRFLPWEEWQSRQSETSLQSRQDAYFAQVRCLTRKLSAALQAFSQSPAGKDGIVIIHGDHGSRLTRMDPTEPNVGKFNRADMVAGFSTLFAVRGPEVTPAYFVELQPVATLLRDFTAANFGSAPLPDPTNVKGVFLDDEDLVPRRRVPLPNGWAAAGITPADAGGK